MPEDSYEHTPNTTLHKPQLEISLHMYKVLHKHYIVLNNTYKIHETKIKRFVRYSRLKWLNDLGIGVVSMIYEQFGTLEAINWIDQ